MGRNADTVHANQEHFNNRDWDALVAAVADECVFIDGQGQVLRGKDGIRAYSQGWVTAFSDGKVTDVRIYDAGDTVVTEFVGRGTHDGPLGPIPATGKSVSLPYVEISHFDADGKITSGRAYFDMLGLMTQLGVAPETAAGAAAMPSQSSARKGQTAGTS